MQLENTKIKEMDVNKLVELLAHDMNEISNKYSFAFDSKKDAINLMTKFIKTEYSKIDNNSIDFHESLENVMNNYVKSIFETECESLYTKVFNNYMEKNILDVSEYKQVHNEIKKIINFFRTINYQPSEIICSNILESNSKFSKMIEKVVDRYSKRLKTMNVEEIFPDSTLSSFVSVYAFQNGIEIKTNDEEQDDIDFEDIVDTDYQSDDIKLYVKNLPKPLTPSKQKELFIRLKEGDETVREQLIEGNLRLVLPIASHYVNKGVDFLDLIQEGNIGLMTAVNKYDYEKGYAFSTYAHWWIKNYVTKSIMKYGKSIKIPLDVQELVRKHNLNFNTLTNKLKRYPTQEELVKEFNLTDKQLYQFMMGNSKLVSLDEPLGVDNDQPIGDFIAKEELSVEEKYEEKALATEIRNVLNSGLLDERTIEILKLRNGFYNNRVYPLQEVSDMFKISKQRVDQLEKRAYQKLKNSSRTRNILGYLANGNKIEERITKEKNLVLTNRKAKRIKKNQEEKPSIQKVYYYFAGYKKEELAEVIGSLPEEDLEVVKELFGNNLEKLSYRKTATQSTIDKFSNQIVPVIESKLNSDYIKILNYYIRCNGLSFDYEKEEYVNLDSEQFTKTDKINYSAIRKMLLVAPQTDMNHPSFSIKRREKNKTLSNDNKGEQPKILIYK